MRMKDYDANRENALKKKKLDACDRKWIKIERKKGNNYVIRMPTTAFKITRQCLVNMLHTPKHGDGGN